jgi:ABC-type sulfate transport system substrate-binding protein
LNSDYINKNNINSDWQFLDEYPKSVKHLKNLTQEEVDVLMQKPSEIRTSGNEKYSIMDLSKVEFKTENDIKSFLLSNF